MQCPCTPGRPGRQAAAASRNPPSSPAARGFRRTEKVAAGRQDPQPECDPLPIPEQTTSLPVAMGSTMVSSGLTRGHVAVQQAFRILVATTPAAGAATASCAPSSRAVALLLRAACWAASASPSPECCSSAVKTLGLRGSHLRRRLFAGAGLTQTLQPWPSLARCEPHLPLSRRRPRTFPGTPACTWWVSLGSMTK